MGKIMNLPVTQMNIIEFTDFVNILSRNDFIGILWDGGWMKLNSEFPPLNAANWEPACRSEYDDAP